MNRNSKSLLIALVLSILVVGGLLLAFGGSDTGPARTPVVNATSTMSKLQDKVGGILPFAEKAKLAPHKAIYKIELVSSSGGSQIINIRGDMYFEWRPGCDAWTTDHRFNLIYEYADSPAMQVTSDFTTYEPYDGSGFSFSSRRSRDGEIYEELRGKANPSSEQDKVGEIIYSVPPDLKQELPAGTLFPMAHTKFVAEHLNETGTFINKTVFDGSDQEGAVEINAFIGKKIDVPPPSEKDKAIDAGLLASPAHEVQMAFFPLTQVDSPAADYEMKAVLHENSVISDMVIDYHEFSVRQKLVALEPVEADEACAK